MRSLLILLATILLSSPAARAEAGSELFARHCVTCHGPAGLGNGPMAPTLQPPPRDLTSRPYKHGCGYGPILRTITEGVAGTGMPSFSILSQEERETLADYVFQLSRQKSCGCKKH